MHRNSSILALAALLLAAPVCLWATEVMTDGWRVGPLRVAAESENDITLVPNNGWAVCRSDQSGDVHVVWTAGSAKPRVYYVRSTDHGQTWDWAEFRCLSSIGGHDRARQAVAAVKFTECWR